MRPSSYQVSAVHHVVLSLPNPRVKQQKCQSKRKQHKTPRNPSRQKHYSTKPFDQVGKLTAQSVETPNWWGQAARDGFRQAEQPLLQNTHTFMWKCAVSRGLLSPHLSVMLMKLNSTNTTQPPHFLFFLKKKIPLQHQLTFAPLFPPSPPSRWGSLFT